MVKDIKHAKQIQQRRTVSGKRGFAKAVRRFMQRHLREIDSTYSDLMKSLPVIWDKHHDA